MAVGVAAVAHVVWSSDRGLNFFDEGYYLLASRHPEDVLAWSNAAHVYTGRLFAAVGYDVVLFRLTGLALLLGSGGVLSLGVSRLRGSLGLGPSGRLERAADLAFIQLGVLLYYNLFLPSPSYNLLNAAALNVAAGLVALVLARPEGGPPLALLGVGLAAGLSFFVKFSSGLSLLVLAGGVLGVWPGPARSSRIRAGAWIAGGFALWLVLHFALLQSPPVWWRMTRHGYAHLVAAEPRYGLASLGRYWTTLSLLPGAGLGLLRDIDSLLAAGLVVLAVAARLDRPLPVPAGALVTAALLAAGWRSWRSDLHWKGGFFGEPFADFYAAWTVLLLVALAGSLLLPGSARRVTASPLRLLLAAGLLGVLPFVGAVGTRDTITILVLANMGPYFAVLLLALALLARISGSRLVLPVGTLVLGLFAGAQVGLRGMWQPPYGLGGSTLAQTVPTEVGVPGTTLGLSATRSARLAYLRALARDCGFRPGDDVLAFYNMPTAVFALGGRSPGVPWYVPGRRRIGAPAETVFALVPRERLRRAFVLRMLSGPLRYRRLPKVVRSELGFPAAYTPCGRLPGIYERGSIELWKPRARDG